MSKKTATLIIGQQTPLIDRQRKLYNLAEAIEIAQKRKEPLPEDISEWLHRGLKNIACGKDANEVFNVKPEKQGVRKNGFLKETQHKVRAGYIAAATEEGEGKKTTAKAIDEISEAMPATKKSTIKKNYNMKSTDRKPTFRIGKK
jgi:hypothetical protein